MNELEIAQCLGKNVFTRRWYRGTFARNEVADIVPWPQSIYIFNYSSRDEEGTHWTALIINRNSFPIYFDSCGDPPPLYFEEFHKLFENFPLCVYSATQIQADSSKSCGQYCCLISSYVARGMTLVEARAPFGADLLKNERILAVKFRKEFSHVLTAEKPIKNGLTATRYRDTWLQNTRRI